MNLANAPAIVADVLDEVCQSRETLSAVTLAVALVDRRRLSENGDPVGLVSQVVNELGDAGLVTYRLRHQWSDIPLHIRATKLGFKIAGYERETVPVGSIAAKHGAPRQKGPTDFRSQHSSTTGGAIERMSLTDHLDKYPDHRTIHPHPWECGPYAGATIVSNSPEAMARRKKERAIRVVEAIRRIYARETDATFTRIQSEMGVAIATVSRSLDDARTLGLVERVGDPGGLGTHYRLVNEPAPSDPSSSRETILEVLREGEAQDDHQLMWRMTRINAAWRSLGAHSLDHQLFSMEKAGLIEMDVKRNGSVQRLTRIRLRPPKRSSAPATIVNPFILDDIPDDPAADRLDATIPVPTEVQEDAAPFIEAVTDVMYDRFPILDGLLSRARTRDETNRREDAYLSAASALDGVDQPESERLLALATQLARDVDLTSVEAEYLRYAETHPDQEENR